MRRMNCAILLTGWIVLAASPPASAAEGNPFRVQVAYEMHREVPALHLLIDIPPKHFLYADKLGVSAGGGVTLAPLDVPTPATQADPFSGEMKAVFLGPTLEAWYAPSPPAADLSVTVSYQGCSDTLCFFPQKMRRDLALGAPGGTEPGTEGPAAAVLPQAAPAPSDWRAAAEPFTIAAHESGYIRTEAFLAFLDRGAAGPVEAAPPAAGRGWLGVLGVILGILVGGLGLNLTPCVLPLIPVNLAIIGAGAKAQSRGRGFALGGAYGLGMALAYGALGVVVVLTGAKFGTLNSSPWFNLAMAILFVVLAVAAFGFINVDFSRWQGRLGTRASGGGRLAAAFAMGAVAALLAGACVAPVVISVLLLAGSLYSQGNAIGLFLPFLLGLGMALPWPLAGAGLSLLPPPGRWMEWVKRGFGVLILAFAAHYGNEAYSLFRGGENTPAEAFARRLDKARAEGRPVLIDFWATWCKNCHVMEKTTFQDPAVGQKLAAFEVVKYQAEKPSEPPAKEIMDYFGAVGLPTYVVLTPKK